MKTFTLVNADNQVTLLDFGARLIDWQVSVEGKPRPIVLAYPNIEDYCNDRYYLGAVCGPYANRIARGHIGAERTAFKLSCNDGDNHLHGGQDGFDRQQWDVVHQTDNSLTFKYIHPNDQDGYPGPMQILVEYRLSKHTLTLEMSCSASSPTVVGPTGHAYFNLNGTDSGLTGLDQYVKCDAPCFTPLDGDGIPVGDDVSVTETEFDFTQARLLCDEVSCKQLDNNFVFKNKQHCSVLTDKHHQLKLTVRSDYPAVQLYSGSFLASPFQPNQGVCIEPHYGANAPNRDNSYDWLVTPARCWKKTIEYQLTVL